ncbi:hypothetical protein E3N88_07652 [Mikania micrantha]|uniref:Transposase-associated domain-containing protein n=1 Tax=Mikania micrantha TaxID=192012 RepID=A0A5N6PTI7_9ASTR|nr:hypothetical protein E3N88_07652 [Mikania micrantha]
MYRRTNSDGFANMEYGTNVNLFLEIAYSKEEAIDKRVTKHGRIVYDIKCPCFKCQNVFYRSKATIRKHLLGNGFMDNYTKWHAHGETSMHDEGQSSTTMEVDDGYQRMVLDSMPPSDYNPTHHANLSSDTLGGHTPNPEAKGFYDMLQAADEPLWEAPNIPCSSITDSRLSVFKHPSRRLFDKGGKTTLLTDKDKHKAHTYILLNREELQDYVLLFDEELIGLFPNCDQATLDKKKEAEFGTWLKALNGAENAHLQDIAHGPLTYVESHKGYLVNTKFNNRRQQQMKQKTVKRNSHAGDVDYIPSAEDDSEDDDQQVGGSRLDMEVHDVDQDDGYEDIDSGIDGQLHSDSYETGTQHESSDDDESTVGRRGPVAPTPLPEPRSLTWVKFMRKKVRDLLSRARNSAKKAACNANVKVGDALSVIIPYKPRWMGSQIWEKLKSYKECVKKRYGDDASKQPLFDPDSWTQAVGERKKGRVYGFSDISDPHVVMTGTSSAPTNEHKRHPSSEKDGTEGERHGRRLYKERERLRRKGGIQ